MSMRTRLLGILMAVAALAVQAMGQSAPTELQGRFQEGVVELDWHQPDGGTDPSFYKVYRRADADSVFAVVGTPTDDKFFDQSFAPNTLYHYTVTAVFADTVESARSNIVDVFTGSGFGGDSTQVSVSFTSDPPHGAAVGKMFTYTPAVKNMPTGVAVCFSLNDAPDGMTINDSTGEIDWTPLHAGMFDVEIHARACNGSDGEAEQEFVVFVFSGSPGSIVGTVKNDSGTALPGVRIKLFDVSAGEFVLRTTTDSVGHYSFPFVNPSTYFVRAKPEESPYAPQWYNGATELDSATPVVVAESTTVTVNFTLHRLDTLDQRFTLSGTVTDTASNGLAGARVTVYRVDRDTSSGDQFDDEDGHQGDRDPVRDVETDSSGHYSMRLHEGTYIIGAHAEGFLPEYWKDEPSVLQADHLQLIQDTTGIDFSLKVRAQGTGTISGVIRSAADSTGLKAHVVGFQEDSTGEFTGFIAVTHTDSSGDYTLDHLPNGGYLVLAEAGDDYVRTFYTPTGGTPFLDSAAAVSVTGGAVTGINIYLSPDSVEGLNSIAGEISGPAAGVGGAVVVITGSAHEVVSTTTSQGNGSYLAAGLAPGAYTVFFQKPGMTTVSLGVTVTYVNNSPTTTIANAQMTSVSGTGPVGTMTVRSSWNLVSLPVTVSNSEKTAVFPSAVSQAYAFSASGTYQAEPVLSTGAGYWVKFSAPQVLSLTGTARTTETVALNEGWNLIGTLSSSVGSGSVTTTPAGLVASSYFGYSGGYTIATTLDPGKGYWVKSTGSGSLTLTSGIAAPKAAGVVTEELGKLSTLTVKDAAGNTQTLYFGSTARIDAKMVEMPPVAPEGAFDVRFGAKDLAAIRNAATTGTVSTPITIQGAVWPVTVSWAVKSGETAGYRLSTGKALVGSGSVELSAPASLSLIAGSSGLPKAYALAQNYPNPFNPTTEIGFDLPVKSVVTLKVYNLLGQEVTTLLNGESLEAGTHTVRFGASGLATGIYFYRLTAGSFVSVRKMMLVR